MDFAGNDDLRGLSYNFEKFTPREIEQYLSLYIVQGLNLAPQINMKAKNQFQGQVQGNDIIGSIIFDKNFERRRKQFRRYFAVVLLENILYDNQTIGFHVTSSLK